MSVSFQSMKTRVLICYFSAIMFAPAVFLLLIGTILIPPSVIHDLMRGHFVFALWLLPLFGGFIGLGAAFLITADIAGAAIGNLHISLKRGGLIIGFISEMAVIVKFQPHIEPFLVYWLPPLVGASVLFALSYWSEANKGFNRTPESSGPAKPGEFGGGAG